MTADRPRLAAAAEDVFPVVVELHGCLHLPDSTMQQLRYALAPHVPERDELVAALRAVREWVREKQQSSASEVGWAASGSARAMAAVGNRLDLLLARHAPEPTDG